jgi:hypothetical protein
MISRVALVAVLMMAGATPVLARGRGGPADQVPPPSAAPHAKSLYERLGGAEEINGAADSYREQILHDSDILARERQTAAMLLTDLMGRLCKTDGKKCLYEGTDDPPLKSLLHVSTKAFEALARNFGRYLGYHGASPADVAEAVKKMHEVQYYLVDRNLDFPMPGESGLLSTP